MHQRIFTLKILDKWSDGTLSSEGSSVVAPSAASSNGLGEMSSEAIVLSVGQLSEGRYDTVVGNDGQVFFISGDVRDGSANRAMIS